MSNESAASYHQLVLNKEVIITCGTGGVGKTTVAAATAIAAAKAARNAIVVTIDPAKRLADALGIHKLGNNPKLIKGDWTGTLSAMMLDSKATFDDLVRDHANSKEQIERIFGNRFYVNLSTELPGTQDYMACEKLYQLHASNRWDLVVIDTPPTRDALALLEAPKAMSRLLNNTIYKMLISPRPLLMRTVNRAAVALVRRLSRVVGVEIVDDAIEFFQTFQGMEAGFLQRAQATQQLLTDPKTAFVLVASPRHDAIAEASYFLKCLSQGGAEPQAVVVNRMLPEVSISATEANTLKEQLKQATQAVSAAAQALCDQINTSEGDQAQLRKLMLGAPNASLNTIPLLPTDVSNQEKLNEFAEMLTTPTQR